ncbi:phage integrase SAM-like domain-containing protein [Flavobacterium sp. Arc3]|uniref:phage integrase SAM-like domain-containing protein n=1 Tax=Flavobacterium sp. Arc3 TaxID=3046686 RepID=UPI00352DB95C
MATGNYRIKTDNDWNSIYFRFKQGGLFDIEISTGLQCPKGRWSSTKQEILTTKEVSFKDINVKLKELDTYVRKEYECSKLEDETILINSKWLKGKIDFFLNKETKDLELNERLFLTSFINSFIEESRTKKTRTNTPVKNRTIQHYTTTLNKITAFEKHIGNKIKLTEINLKFHSNFIDFLESVQILNPNTIGGYVDDIKLFCRNADNKGYEIPNDYKLQEFYSPTNKTNDIYLKETEINAIFSTHFEQDSLDNARDWLIIGLRTGLRISDFLTLSKKDIIDGFIQIQTKKTDYPVIIPLHQEVLQILAKRHGDFPRNISDQKLNTYVKEVAKIAGLNEQTEGAKMCKTEVMKDGKKTIISRKKFGKYPKHELVSSHICRRTFATLLYGKIDTLTIMKITGHQTEKQFLGYIKITPKEYAQKLKDYWRKMED